MTIVITSPLSGDVISGTEVITGTTSSQVTATLGGSSATAQIDAVPFSVSIDTTQLVNGSGVLTVDNGVGIASVTVTVRNIAPASADGTTCPAASHIDDGTGNVWTLVNGVVKLNGLNAGFTSQVALLLWFGGAIYQQNVPGKWWKWVASAWNAVNADPRVPPVVIPPAPPKLFYGVNIHPGNGVYQTLGAPKIAALINDVGFTVARMDCYRPSDSANVKAWCKTLAGANITPLIILLAAHYDGDEAKSYASGYALGNTMATECGAYTSYYEMGNEYDDKCGRVADGLMPQCFDQAKWVGFRGVMRGVYDGVKSVQPNATLIFAAGTVLNQGFALGMAQGKDPAGLGGPVVAFDAMTWHWYESSGDPTHTGSSKQAPPCGSPNGGLNMFEFCASFGKPVWWTEIGAKGQDTPAQQGVAVTNMMGQFYALRKTNSITNVCWYQLIATGADGGVYGIMEADGVTHRPAYDAMKAFIAAHPV